VPPWEGEVSDTQGVIRGMFRQSSDIFVGVGVVAVVMMMIIPLPTFLLDALMAVNLVLALLVILIVLYMKHALEFTVFPALLLILTVFGLALNVSSTRLILSMGSRFDGHLVRAFGTFVVGTEGTKGYVIGFIIFLIIIAVQFMVITKGSTRVAEVAARFTLDALPGKQMAIEAEYNSGLITEEEASRRKGNLQKEVDFYGAMDGSSKFVAGNVKVGILITVINIVGGFIVGMSLLGESFQTALTTYIPLAIGDGLVTQLPALLISTSTGIIVTRSVSEASFGHDVTKQFTREGRPFWIAGAILALLGFLPGFPWYVLFPLAGLLGVGAVNMQRKAAALEEEDKAKATGKAAEAPAEVSPVVPLDPLSLELGYGLIPLVDKDRGAELLDRITRIRREAALDLGIVVPRIRIIDNMRLEPPEYIFKIKGVEVGRARIRMNQYLAINPGDVREEITGEAARDPAFGLPAIWIGEDDRERAERAGYTVVDPPSIIATHLTEIIKRHAAEILGRQEVQSILDALKHDYPAVVEAVVKLPNSTGLIQKVLQGLLREQVSIRNIVTILETLSDYGTATTNVAILVEKARQSIARQISLANADENRILHVFTLSASVEQKIIDSRVETAEGVTAGLEPQLRRRWVTAVSNSVRRAQELGRRAIVLCSEAARPLVKASTQREVPYLVVMSVPEVDPEISVESLGEITWEASA
jgi:flagellar biosynthesis protein FlhA